METVITVLILLVIIGSAAYYVYRAKKSGKKCIGCPDSGGCTGNCAHCGCCSHEEK
ncbi:MAG: FeoB-associated Cys-rich membrane protein [Ruminococcaceae bacterium]|nr:FeoB-associated Cys-rich membrane protein [Oscillospiraceae bacterium]